MKKIKIKNIDYLYSSKYIPNHLNNLNDFKYYQQISYIYKKLFNNIKYSNLRKLILDICNLLSTNNYIINILQNKNLQSITFNKCLMNRKNILSLLNYLINNNTFKKILN